MAGGLTVVTMRTPLDVLYLTDLRFPGGSSTSLVEEVRAATAANYRVGALHCQSVSLRADRTFHRGIQSLIDEGRLLLIRPGEPVDCRLVVVKHPTVLVESLGGRLPVRAEAAVVFVGQVPADDDGTIYYDPFVVHTHVAEAFDVEPIWHPVSPMVRRRLGPSGVPLSASDWVEVIDPSEWNVERSGPRGDVPVIGRHGRPSYLKWPDDPTVLKGVYPVDGSADVRILGGVDGLDAVLTEVPDSWTVHEFNSVRPRDFLSGIDFFVYFHHRDLVEAFGRTVIEAMSSGCVVVLPTHFSELFGDGCVYSEASEVAGLIQELHADGRAFMEHSSRGLREVSERFSHSAHVERLCGLVGEPMAEVGRATPTARVPKGLADQRPTVLISCIGAGPEVTADTLRTAVFHRDRTTAFEPIVVCDSSAPEVAENLEEDLELDGGKRCFVGSVSGVVVEVLQPRELFEGAESWEDYVIARFGQLNRRLKTTRTVIANPEHPDAWLAIQATV